MSFAVVTLALAACGHGSSTPTPTGTATPTAVPTASGSAATTAAPCSISLGIAYEPDAGNGGSLHGIQYTHFEDNSENLCTTAATANPMLVTFSSSVGGLSFSSDASDAIALLQNSSGGYSLAQDIFGTAVGSLTPVGAPYDLSVEPTPVPTLTPGASPNPTQSPANAPLISDAQSVSILGSSSSALAFALGTPVTGSTPAIVALTSLTNAPPQYGGAIPFSGTSYTLTSIPQVTRNIVRGLTDANGTTVVLARGPQDLLAFSVTVVATGYQLNATADDTTLGSAATLRGSGAMALDPADASRALIGGTSSGGGNTLTLVTGLPGAITRSATLALPGTSIRSIAITAGGVYAVVGTDVGIVSIGGVDSGSLVFVPPFAPNPSYPTMVSAPSYPNCNNATSTLTNVYSVGFSDDAKYLVALGSGSGVTCASGYNASIVAIPYNPASGSTPSPAPSPSPTTGATASPLPTQFTQNNIVAPPTGSDLMYVH
jgi:hypothetical protein